MKSKKLRELKPEFLRLYNEEKKSIREIARIYNVDKSSISRYIHEDVKPRPRGLTEEQKKYAKRMYESCCYTLTGIANELEASVSTVRTFLIKEYGEIRSSKTNKKYEHLRDSFMKDYSNGLSSWDISKKYNVSPTTILNYIEEKGVKARDYSESSIKYEINEEYFDVLDERKAYLLGLIIGNSSENKKSSIDFIDLRFSKNQKDLLEDILNDIYISEYPIINATNKTLVLRIISKKLVKRILDLKSQIFSEGNLKEIEMYKDYFLKGIIRSSKIDIENGFCLKLYKYQINTLIDLMGNFFKLKEIDDKAKDIFSSNENLKVLGLTFCKEFSVYKIIEVENHKSVKELLPDKDASHINGTHIIFFCRDQEQNIVKK